MGVAGFRDQVAELQRAMGACGTSLQIVTALDEVRRASAEVDVRACLRSAQRSGVRCGAVYRVILGYSVLRAVRCCVISARPRPHRVFSRGTLRARRAPRRAAGRHAPTVRRGISIVRAWHTRQVAWLLNVRGSDIEYNPVVISYATVDVHGSVRWYIDRCAAAYPAQTRPSEPADGH